MNDTFPLCLQQKSKKDTDLDENTNVFIIMPPFKEMGVYCFAHVGPSVGA